MSTYDHFAQNPSFKLWNVVTVKKLNDKTWEINLIGREKEMIATTCIRKMTLAEVQERVSSVPVFYCAREDTGITVINKDECYMTTVAVCNASKEDGESKMKHYLDAGLEDNVIYKMVKRDYETTRMAYELWKALPQTPLENPINTWEPRKCYFGLPNVVYMHLVGQLCANI